MGRRQFKRAFRTLAEWQKSTGLSQGDAAKFLGLSQPHWCNILRGNRKPSLNLAIKLSQLTNVPVEAIAETQRVA